tara:strand:- start:2050 stop:2364 length:315 start_codon:yes stop_codon:yes gene_type:complete
MKKTVMLVALALGMLSTQPAKAQFGSNIEISPRVVTAVAGGAFLLAGALQRPDKVWVSDQNGPMFDNTGNKGYWRNEKFYESPGRSLALASGVFLLGVTVVIKF